MHFLYKLIALSVVFGLVLASPAAKFTSPHFDELAYESGDRIIFEDDADVVEALPYAVPAAGILVPKIGLAGIIATALKFIPKVVGLKVVALSLAVKIIKWVAPKFIFLAIGAILTFGFCKLTDKCSFVTPVVEKLVTPEVRSLVTPERLDVAQEFLMSALQQYAKEELVN